MTDQTNAPTRRRLLSFAATLPAALGLTAGRASAHQAMIPTAPDMEGPFYISNTPVLRDLNRFGKRGEAMRITGRVMNAGSPDMPNTRANQGARDMRNPRRLSLTRPHLPERQTPI